MKESNQGRLVWRLCLVMLPLSLLVVIGMTALIASEAVEQRFSVGSGLILLLAIGVTWRIAKDFGRARRLMRSDSTEK